MRSWVRSLVVGAALFAGPAGARADDAAPPVSALLADPARLAEWLRDRDPRVDAARARIEAARASQRQTRVLPNPQLQVGVGGIVVGAYNPGNLGLSDTLNVDLGLTELVELGKRGPRQASAELRTREAGVGAIATLGDRVSQATTILGKLAYVTARHAAVASNLDAARKLQALEKSRLDNKDLSGSDYARIELDTEQLEIELGRADADIAVAVAACSAALLAPCRSDGLDAATLDAGAPLPPAAGDVAATEATISDRPAHQASRLEVSALESDATLAEHRRLPDLTIGVSYLLDNLTVAGNQHQTIGVSVGIPLALFDRGDHDAAAARATAKAAVAEERAAVREATGQAEALRAQLRILQRTIDRLERESVPKSALILQQSVRAFDLGQTGLAELLLAERAHRDLLLEVLDTRFDLFNVRAQLRQALGVDDQAATASTPHGAEGASR